MARTKGRSPKQFSSGRLNPVARFQQTYQKAQQLHQSGYLSEAEKLYQDILKHIPDNPDCLHYLGLIYFQKGDDKKAGLHFSKAIKTGNNPIYLSNYGLLLHKQLKFEQALGVYQQAVKIQPDYAEAWFNLGVTYSELQDYAAAEKAYKKAISFKKNYIKAMFNLVGVQEMQGKTDDAKTTLDQIQAISPDDHNLYHTLGIVMQNFGGSKNIKKALMYFKKALELEPNSLETLIALAKLQDENNKPDTALTLYDKVLSIEPDYHSIKVARAACLIRCEEVDLAEQELLKILEYDSNNLSVMCSLGNIARIRGDFSGASDIYNKILTYDEYHNGVYLGLAECKKYNNNDNEFIKKVENSANKRKSSLGYFSLGKIYNDLGQYDESFIAYEKANKMRNKRIDYNRQQNTNKVDSIISILTKELVNSLQPYGNASDVPVFILGTPRSGTTLTEQIISSHPNVSGAGELNYIHRLATNRSQQKDTTECYPERMKTLTENDISNEAGIYLAKVQKYYEQDGIIRVTDKMPGNFLYIGFIAILFPKAKIIHCKRNPLDACLSMFFQNFESALEYTFDLKNLAYWYKDYIRLMQHWRSIFGDRILDVEYNDTVNDTETTAKKLIEYCGLDWNEQCIEFHKSKREVRTASQWQVRQPIYKTSLERWKRYDKHIGVLKEILDGLY